MKALTFTIELLEPLLATGSEGDPNAGVSQNFVAGSVLRGAIIGLYLRNGNAIDAADETARNLFFNGKVCFLNAYPQLEGKRGLPVPLSWQKEKDAENNEFFDFSLKENRDEKQYKDLDSPFFVFNNSASIVKIKPETRLAVHTRRETRKGRSTGGEGAVFRYESIVAGTKFGGAVVGDETLLGEIKKWIDGKEVLLGGSRTAGYGKAVFDKAEVRNWNEVGMHERIKDETDLEFPFRFSITLLSNALIRDENGQFQANLSAKDLGLSEDKVKPISEKTFKRAELIGGFNRKWGLPLPQQISVKAGSVFTFKAKQEIEAETIREWLNEGVGERRVDGFGRIAVNLVEQKDTEDKNDKGKLFFDEAANDKVSPVDLTAENGAAKTLGEKLVGRLTEKQFEIELTALVGKHEPDKKINNSQIARLRSLLREVLRNEKKIEDVIGIKNAADKYDGGFFNGLRKTARTEFEKVKIDRQPFKVWVEKTLENQDDFIRHLPTIGKLRISGEKLKEMNEKFRLRLIDGVLARMAKENKQ